MKTKWIFVLIIAMVVLTACSADNTPTANSPTPTITAGGVECPPEAENAFAAILLISQSIAPTDSEDITRQVAYNGIEKIDGSDCYSFTVYSDLSDRYETLGTYFKKLGEEVYYYYDAVNDTNKRVIIGDNTIFLEDDEPPT
jgi:hypothetical protein